MWLVCTMWWWPPSLLCMPISLYPGQYGRRQSKLLRNIRPRKRYRVVWQELLEVRRYVPTIRVVQHLKLICPMAKVYSCSTCGEWAILWPNSQVMNYTHCSLNILPARTYSGHEHDRIGQSNDNRKTKVNKLFPRGIPLIFAHITLIILVFSKEFSFTDIFTYNTRILNDLIVKI